MKTYYVYMLTNRSNHVLYLGMTNDLLRRMSEHRNQEIEGFAQKYQASKPVYYDAFPDPASAIAHEKRLKGWRREKKVALIRRHNPRWFDLFDEIAGPEEKRLVMPSARSGPTLAPA